VDRKDLLLRLDKIRRDPWEFLSTCVYTLDQVDQENPIKKFPVDLRYLYLYTRCWQRYPKIAVPKSRRMIMSWTNIALYLWDTMFHAGKFNAFVSRKEDAADELIKRAEFIYDHIPEEVIPRELLPKKAAKFSHLDFPEINSQLQGFPQGSDQLRQYTFSGIFGDEMGFWEEAQAMYSASMPTLEGGGRFTGVSSPAPGFFKSLVFDQLDLATGGQGREDKAYEENKVSNRFPTDGVEIWINPKNKFLIFQLHYSANPIKRDETYRESIKSSMPRAQYLQEYELQWDSFSGLPVYGDFQEKYHGSKTRLQPESGLPLLRGWDFGLTPACVVAQLQGERLVVLWEMVELNMGAERFVPKVLQALRIEFPEWGNSDVSWRDFADPSGVALKDTDMGSCFKVMAKNGIKVTPGAVAWEPRRSSVEHFLLKHTKEGPGLQLDLEKCPVLARGFKGGYRYPEKAEEIEPMKLRPIKDEHSHPHDALQMITSKIVNVNKVRKRSIPAPGYSWSGPSETKVEVPV
jgi:hypothetical protein